MTEAPPPPPQEPDGSAGGATPPSSDPYGQPAQPSQPAYGQPTPPPAYGQPTPPPAYGQPAPPPAYGEQPPAYGAPAYGAPPAGMPANVQLASWGVRLYGALFDYILPGIVANVVGRANSSLGLLLQLAALAWALYNCYLGGTTGQSYGKKIAGIRLAREADGQNIGGGLGIGRYFVHIVDTLACLLGWLWPLWDAKRQTFADKILKTVVVKV